MQHKKLYDKSVMALYERFMLSDKSFHNKNSAPLPIVFGYKMLNQLIAL